MGRKKQCPSGWISRDIRFSIPQSIKILLKDYRCPAGSSFPARV
jgi:hypothetical protein